MDELAAVSVWTIRVFMKLLAKLGLVPRRHMLFLLQLTFTMCKSARVAIWAVAFLLEGSAQLSLDLDLVVFGHDTTVVLESEGVVDGVGLINLVDPFEFLVWQELGLIVDLVLDATDLVVKRSFLRMVVFRSCTKS